MSQTLEIKNWYKASFENFENHLNGERENPIHKLRREAIAKFEELKFPTTKDEEWKYTNISPILQHNFKISSDSAEIEKEEIKNFSFGDLDAYRLVFVNGLYSKRLSNLSAFGEELSSKVEILTFAEAIKNNCQPLEKHFAKYANFSDNIFTALNTSFLNDGAVVDIKEGAVLDKPIHLLFLASPQKEETLIQPRNLIIVSKNSQAKIIEHYAGLEGLPYFTNAVTEIFVDENGILDHIKFQEESLNAYHISGMEVVQQRNSSFRSNSISLGGSITRNDINSKLNDVGAESTLNGLYLTKEKQLYDTHSVIDHAKPNCQSHELYKGILDDEARGVFNGKVLVRKDAQKTNAFQENNNVILSDSALVNTKPQLEIFADDVKCSHGATVGQLDKQAQFYLRSRGIDEKKALSILIYAFASEVLKGVAVEEVKNYVEHILEERFLISNDN